MTHGKMSFIYPTEQSSYVQYHCSYQRKMNTCALSKCIYCNKPLSHNYFRLKMAMNKLNAGIFPEVGNTGIFFRTVHNECLHVIRRNKNKRKGRYQEKLILEIELTQIINENMEIASIPTVNENIGDMIINE